jgi:hypothetical protein
MTVRFVLLDKDHRVPIAALWNAVSTAETCRVANNDNNKCVAAIECEVQIAIKHDNIC